MTEPKDPPTVQNKALAPPGVLPKNAQTWVIVGLATVMALVIAFSGSNAPKGKPPVVPPMPVTDANQSRIEEYRRRIEVTTQRLREEKDQLDKQRAAASVAGLAGVGDPSRSADFGRSPTYGQSSAYGPVYAQQKSWIEEDREKRGYLSLFSPNVALSYRDPSATRPSERPEQSTLDRASRRSRTDSKPQNGPAAAALETADEKDMGDQAAGPKHRLFEGTVIETVLTNRLDGAYSGPVNCMTTTDLYSHSGRHVLIPAGSRVLGEAKRVDALGQERLAVVFHRLIMPDGYSVSLDKFQGLNQIGETGLRDQINHHYLRIFGVSIAIGSIAGLAQANTRSGFDMSAADAYRQGVAGSLSQSSLRILDRYLNVLPTITIREGQRVKIYLAGDLLLPAYDNHRMPEDL